MTILFRIFKAKRKTPVHIEFNNYFTLLEWHPRQRKSVLTSLYLNIVSLKTGDGKPRNTALRHNANTDVYLQTIGSLHAYVGNVLHYNKLVLLYLVYLQSQLSAGCYSSCFQVIGMALNAMSMKRLLHFNDSKMEPRITMS